MKTLIVRVNEVGDFPETPHYDQVIAKHAWDYCNGDMAAAVASVLGQNLDIAPVIERVELAPGDVEGLACYETLRTVARAVVDAWEQGKIDGALTMAMYDLGLALKDGDAE
jgi:hypothetical protein